MHTQASGGENKACNQAALRVILGAHTVRAFVTAPKKFEIIGIVAKGLEFGLLGLDPAGEYVRVNGSQLQQLDQQEVEVAIAVAHASKRLAWCALTPEQPVYAGRCKGKPSVVVRKHRRPDPVLMARPV